MQILGILIIGMTVPYNDDELLRSTGNAAQSPFVIAISRSGIKGVFISRNSTSVMQLKWLTVVAISLATYHQRRYLY